MLTFDGDFDILLKRFKDSTIVFNNESLTVNEFLDIYYKRLGLSVLPFDEYYGYNNNLNHITDLYPKIQISIPVNIEEWDLSYNPVVVFVPRDYNEGVTANVIGYKNNSVLLVDAEIPPNNPIVVIGRNERTDPRPVIISPPDVNIVLQGNTYQGGIKLSWTVSDLNKPISGYNIYRKGESQYDFERVRVNNNKYNTTFEDNDVNSLVSYTYFVRAYNYSGESPPSNYKEVVAPDVPYPVSTFKAIINTNSWAELRWQHKQGQYIDHTDLFKRKFKISQPPEYELIGRFDNDETEYFDLLFPQNGGDRYDYKIVEVSNMGNSNPLYDFITVPTRDIEQASSVRIKQISYVSGKKNEIEGWLKGAPEFRISVVKGTSEKTASVVQEEIYCDMDKGYTYKNYNTIVTNWLPSDWMEKLTFKVVEYDYGPNIDLKVNAGYDKKDSTQTKLISGSITLTLDDLLNNKDEIVGQQHLRFIDPVDFVLEFPNGGVKIQLGQ